MRGKEMVESGATEYLRITPAYAGKSSCFVGSSCFGGDHPRICGEKAGSYLQSMGLLGSPPHMRGKAALDSVVHAPLGITPAYAGKSVIVRPLRSVSVDHPRICGEKPAFWRCWCFLLGSPPHMRGKD